MLFLGGHLEFKAAFFDANHYFPVPTQVFLNPWERPLQVVGFPFGFPSMPCRTRSFIFRQTRIFVLFAIVAKDRGWKIRALIFLPAMGDLVGSILSFIGRVSIQTLFGPIQPAGLVRPL